MDLLCRVRNKIMYVLSRRTVSALTRVLLLCLIPLLLRNSGNKHKNNPLVSAETVRHSSTYIILYFTHWRRYGDVKQHGNSVDWSSIRSNGIQLGQFHLYNKIPQPSIIKISLKISNLKFHKNLPGTDRVNCSPKSPEGPEWTAVKCYLFISGNLRNINPHTM